MAKKTYVALRGKTDYYDCETTFVCSPEYFENFVIELDEKVSWRIQDYLAKEGIKLVELIHQSEAKIDIKRLICQFEIEEANMAKKRKLKVIDMLLKHDNKDEVREALEAACYIEKGGVFIT